VKVTRFDADDSLILVHAMIWGPRGHSSESLAVIDLISCAGYRAAVRGRAGVPRVQLNGEA
jgi:hypothetical protein